MEKGKKGGTYAPMGPRRVVVTFRRGGKRVNLGEWLGKKRKRGGKKHQAQEGKIPLIAEEKSCTPRIGSRKKKTAM